MQPKKPWFVTLGDFFFKYRNLLFPLGLGALFVTCPPPWEYGGRPQLENIKDILAGLIIAAGLGVRATVIGFAYIKRGGLNKKVYADQLVTEGFFRLCRNPLYLGNMLIYGGIFLMHGDPYVIVCGTLGMYAIYASIIAAEEFFLHHKFGASYAEYCRTVPRWWPLWRMRKEALHGMRFNAKRVLLKDYSTMLNAAATVLVIDMLERNHHVAITMHNLPLCSIGALAALILAGAAVSRAKSRKCFSA